MLIENNLRLRIQLSEGKGADETDIDDEKDSGGLSLVRADDDQDNLF